MANYPITYKNGVMDAPIPGSSLTKEPGKHPWEQPSKFIYPQEAADYVWQRLMQPHAFVAVLGLLESGAPASAIADGILQECMMQGMFSMDITMLIRDVVFTMIAAMGAKAGIKVRLKTDQSKPGQRSVEALIKLQRANKENNAVPPEMPTEQTVQPIIDSLQSKEQGFLKKLPSTPAEPTATINIMSDKNG